MKVTFSIQHRHHRYFLSSWQYLYSLWYTNRRQKNNLPRYQPFVDLLKIPTILSFDILFVCFFLSVRAPLWVVIFDKYEDNKNHFLGGIMND